MNIRANSVVAIDYVLKNDAGEIIDSNDDGEPLTYLHGHENIVPGLERALDGKVVGDVLDVVVAPVDGYGERDLARIMTLKRDQLPEDLAPEVGMMLSMTSRDGHTVPITITAVSPTGITVDGNHELAGETLHFHVKVKMIRDATREELAHGHVHGPGGHHA